ncbi:XdhC family protein [Geotalea toluenoxydans]|uniref:XdhC family protein n=1 Tax=Geotalea toluenoxydans TaxID=421624 RepID=UPI0006D08E74|nr:XdhC family protein [Geotalea toluenoxydans]
MWDWIGKLDELRRSNQLAVLVTVTKSSGSTPRKGGAKMIVLPDGTFYGTVGGGTPEYYALEDARKCFDSMQGGNSSVPLKARGEFPACGGTMEYHMELINDNPVLYVFGAGHIGQSLAHVLEGTPFRVHLIDERDEWINSPTLPGSVIRHQCHYSDFIAKANWCDKRSFVTIMTYSGTMDQQVLEEVLPHPTRYAGMVGSKSKWAGIKKNLEAKGLDLSAVRCPIGHDNGGNSPREIAISIASQLLATYYGRE